MPEEHERSYYEIQLDHRQLILIFLTAIGILVVMFLLGMRVGQGKGFGPLQSVASADTSENDGTDRPGKSGSKDAGKSSKENHGKKTSAIASNRGSNSSPQKSKTGSQAPGDKRESTSASRTVRNAPAQTQKASIDIIPSSLPLSLEKGYSVQVMALTEKAKASEIRQILKSKGYPAFIDPSTSKKGKEFYRIRIGKFLHQRDAILVKEKLGQEEGFKNMIVVQ
ncbi:SPOR domain-containing protein [Acidobacteriota bacterium]